MKISNYLLIFFCLLLVSAGYPEDNFKKPVWVTSLKNIDYHFLNTPIMGQILHFQPWNVEGSQIGPLGIKDIAISTSPTGKLYSAVAYNWGREVYEGCLQHSVLKVFRYDTTNMVWLQLAEMVMDGDWENPLDDWIYDIGLSAGEEGYVWLAYSNCNPPDATETIRVLRIPDSTGQTLSETQFYPIRSFSINVRYPQIDITYDEKASIVFPTSRIVYRDENGYIKELKVIRYDDGTYSQVQNISMYSATGYEAKRIVYNPIDDANQKRAYSVFEDASHTDAIAGILHVPQGSSEYWSNDVLRTYGKDPDITWRGNGNYLSAWWMAYGGWTDLETNAGKIAEDGKLPRLVTDRTNQRDISAVWKDVIDIDGDESVDNVWLVREVYP